MEFNLTEAFKEQYEVFLQEEANRELNESFDILENGQKEYLEALNILESYMSLFEVKEEKVIDKTEEKQKKKDESQLNDSNKTLINTIKVLLNNEAKDKSSSIYNPVAGYQQVTKLSEMKFPQNIVFFITQLISWIKNLVLAFIDKFTNAVRLLLGIDKERRESRFSEDDLKLKLNSVKEISTKYMMDPSKETGRLVNVFSIPADEFSKYGNLVENFEPLNEFDNRTMATKDIDKQPSVKIIQIDTSRDLMNLEADLAHFINLYKDAMGSNNEWLFGSDDLELLFNIFVKVKSDIENYRVPSYDISGTLTEVDTIDKDKLRNNFILTQTNTENLKHAYLETSRRIKNVGSIVGHKQLLGAQGMGIEYGFLSAASYEVMIRLLKSVNLYLKDAESNNKQLEKMRDKYARLSDELGKMRTKLFGVSSEIVYGSIYQKRIDNLFMAARYMTQTITLRLTTLGLYIKELKDIKELLINLNAVNFVRKSNKFFNIDEL